jgi:radical SAM protein with 4Fe4S-binding SPASM domain
VSKHATPSRLANLALIEVERRMKVIHPRGMPYVFAIEPTNACNLKCPLCPTGLMKKGRDTGMIDMDLFYDVVDQISPFAFRVWLYNWGEPLMHKGIFEMISYLREKRLASVLSSNMTLWKEGYHEEIVKSGLEWIVMSLDGVDEESFSTYRVGGKFETAIENVRKLVEAKRRLGSDTPTIEWQFLMFNHNLHLLDKARELAYSSGADLFNPMPVNLAESPFTGEYDRAEAENWIPMNADINPDTYESGKPFFDQVCPWPWYTMTVNWDGGVSPCCRVTGDKWDLGNVKKSSIREVWRGEKYRQLREIVSTHVIPEGYENIICATCREFKYPDQETVIGKKDKNEEKREPAGVA